MGEYISDYLYKIINDKNISRQGREMLIVLKSLDSNGKNKIRVTLRELLYKFDTQNRERVCNTLRELESKGYIAIDKSVGRVNTYTFLKEHLIRTTYGESIIDANRSDGETLPRYENSSKESLLCNENSGEESLLCNENSREESLSGYERGRREYLLPNEITSKETLSALEKSNEENLPALEKSSEENLPALQLYNINNNYINNNTNDIFINIFNHWNKQSISDISDLDLRVRDSMNIALSKYAFESIIKAISNYSEVYHSDYFYNIKWNLNSFLTNSKAIDKFQDNGQMWQQYGDSKYSDKKCCGDDGLDKYKYIDV